MSVINKWSEDETKYLLDNYKHQTYKEIGAFLGRKEVQVYDKARYIGLKKFDKTLLRNYSIDFFKNDSPELAYFLGWAVTDGNLTKWKNKHIFQINIHVSDGYILQELSKLICGEDKTSYSLSKRIRNGEYKEYESTRFHIYNKEIFYLLKDTYLITPRKTGNEQVPPTKFHNDLLRGIFDGDGSIGINSSHHLQYRICCTNKPFLETLQQTHGNVGHIYSDTNDRNLPLHTWFISKINDVYTIYRQMYTNHQNLYLKRKKQIFDTYYVNKNMEII